jgi:amino acid transporter
VICGLGAALRFWSSGYLRKNTRPSVGGPYHFTRNPLYLGTYIMLIGASIAVDAWFLAAASSIVFAVVYHCVILDEEEKLERIFGEPYRLYLQTVSRFFPQLWPPQRTALLAINPVESHLKFSWALTRENRAHPWVSFIAIIGFLWIVAALRSAFFPQ